MSELVAVITAGFPPGMPQYVRISRGTEWVAFLTVHPLGDDGHSIPYRLKHPSGWPSPYVSMEDGTPQEGDEILRPEFERLTPWVTNANGTMSASWRP
jgi:hypothetical protein